MNINERVAEAFISSQDFKKGVDKVENKKLYLHGNIIAEYRDEYLWITDAGWSSRLTKNRLNALPGVNLKQKDYVWYLNEEKWDGSWRKV